MKLLLVPQLTAISNSLSWRQVGDVIIDGRLEAYSLKKASADKKFAYQLRAELVEEEVVRRERSASLSQVPALASATSRAGGSPPKSGDDSAELDLTHKTLVGLIGAMNASNPDYDFSSLRSNNFVKITELSTIKAAVNRYLADLDKEESREPTLPQELDVASISSGAISGNNQLNHDVKTHSYSKKTKSTPELSSTKVSPTVRPENGEQSLTMKKSKNRSRSHSLSKSPLVLPVEVENDDVSSSDMILGGGKGLSLAEIDERNMERVGRSGSVSIGGRFQKITESSFRSAAVNNSNRKRRLSSADSSSSVAKNEDETPKKATPSHSPALTAQSSNGNHIRSHAPQPTQADFGLGSSFLDTFWTIIDRSISLKDCEFYVLKLDADSDPFSEDCLWSFNFFFLNRPLNRLLYLTCNAKSVIMARQVSHNFGPSRSPDFGVDSDMSQSDGDSSGRGDASYLSGTYETYKDNDDRDIDSDEVDYDDD